MKKLLLLGFVLTTSIASAQLESSFKTNYIDFLTSSYNFNYAISLASPKGNYIKALELLQNDYFKKNAAETFLIQSLLTHNTYGKDSAFILINKSLFSTEEKDFAKLWLNFHTHNYREYDSLIKAFCQNYPSNYFPIKLRLRKIINYKHKNFWNKRKEDKEKSIHTIDSLLALPTLCKEDSVYFSLFKLNFLEINENSQSEKEYPEKKILDNLAMLFNSHKELFNLKLLKNLFERKEKYDYRNTLKEIEKEQRKTTNFSSSQNVYNLLITYNSEKIKKPISELENEINFIYDYENNVIELEKISALITLFDLAKTPRVGFILDEKLKPISFTKLFKQKFDVTINKEKIIKNINILLKWFRVNEEESKGDINSIYKNEIELLSELTAKDVNAFYGLLIFYANFLESLNEMTFWLNKYQDDPTGNDYKNTNSYLAFLEKNPLYLNDQRFVLYFLTFEKGKDVFNFIEKLNALKAKLLGAATISRNGIMCVLLNCKAVPNESLQEFYIAYFKLIVDYLCISNLVNEEDSFEDFLYEPNLRLKQSSSYDRTLLDNLIVTFSEENIRKAQQYVDTKLLKFPNNIHLLKAKEKIEKVKL